MASDADNQLENGHASQGDGQSVADKLKVFAATQSRILDRQPLEAHAGIPERLPHRVTGGFRGVGDALNQRAREWRTMSRLLDQMRQQVDAATAEGERLQAKLARAVPEAQDSSRALKALIENTKSGDVSGDLASQFQRNLTALEELENVSQNLVANILWVRSAWEQYAQTVIEGNKMRDGTS